MKHITLNKVWRSVLPVGLGLELLAFRELLGLG